MGSQLGTIRHDSPRAYPVGCPRGEPLPTVARAVAAADIKPDAVVSGAENGGSHVVGMVTRDSILRVVQTGQSWAQ